MNANSGNPLPSIRILGILGCTKTKIWDEDRGAPCQLDRNLPCLR